MKSPIDYDHLPMNWVGDWAGQRRRLTPERPALVVPETGWRLNYRELDDCARQFAQWLANHAHLRAGDIVALIAQNRAEALLLYLACGKLGLILAPISYRLAATDQIALLERINPQLLVIDSALDNPLEGSQGVLNDCRHFGIGGDDCDYTREVAVLAPEPINNALPMAQTSLLVHTGGSTGLPKICAVSYRQMLWNAFELMSAAPEGLGNRREMVLFPLYHIGGWNTVMPIWQAGGCVVMPTRFDPNTALACIEVESINHFGAVEAMLQALIASEGFASARFDSLEGITTAGAPCAPATMAAFLDRGIPISQAYGLTEAGPSNFHNPRAGQTLAGLRASANSIGQALAYSDWALVERHQGSAVSAGAVGELHLRSAHNFSGYWDDPAQTTERLSADGWVATGDLARERPDGGIELVGRVDNMLVIGGENIAAEALERDLEAHADIDQALVFGVPDARWGTRAVACVVGPAPDTQASLEQWAKHTLAAFQRPIAWEIMTALPLTGAGKLDRRKARADYLERRTGEQ